MYPNTHKYLSVLSPRHEIYTISASAASHIHLARYLAPSHLTPPLLRQRNHLCLIGIDCGSVNFF